MAYQNLAQGVRSRCVAFDGDRLIAQGEAGDVGLAAKRVLEANPKAQILIFDDETSRTVDMDLVGTDEEILRWIGQWAPKPSLGRPKLGVVPREVTLLPRHWEWLAEQPGGASAALRRLVDEARKSPREAARQAQEAAYRFAVTMAGDRPNFEEASRALFANDAARFAERTEAWPPDVRERARELAARAFASHWDSPHPDLSERKG